MIGKWPGLAADFLTGPGDLQVVHNYRNVLAPILLRQGAGPYLQDHLPGLRNPPARNLRIALFDRRSFLVAGHKVIHIGDTQTIFPSSCSPRT